MSILHTLRRELDRAGEAAQAALDEGTLRLAAHRARHRAESAAASLGYALYRARSAGADLDSDRYQSLAAGIAAAEAEVAELEERIAAVRRR